MEQSRLQAHVRRPHRRNMPSAVYCTESKQCRKHHEAARTIIVEQERGCGIKQQGNTEVDTASPSVLSGAFLVPSRAVMIYHLSLDNPLPLVVPSVVMMSSVATLTLPLIAKLALVLNLPNTLLSAGAHAVGDLNQLENVLLFRHKLSVLLLHICWRAGRGSLTYFKYCIT